jgi:hypothetical protein
MAKKSYTLAGWGEGGGSKGEQGVGGRRWRHPRDIPTLSTLMKAGINCSFFPGIQ